MTIQSGLQRVRQALLENGHATPSDIAAQTRLAQPTVSQHLRALENAGLVESIAEGKRRIYRPRPHLHVDWTRAQAHAGGQAWRRDTWSTEDVIDWRFGLASRITDRRGHEVAVRFLEALLSRGVVTPWLVPSRFGIQEWIDELDDTRAAATLTAQTYRPEAWGPWTLVAFGSCVRGDARPESDLDVLVVTEPEGAWKTRWNSIEVHDMGTGWPIPYPDWKTAFQQTADDVNLGAARYVDLHQAPADKLKRLPPPLRESIRNEGIVLYTNGRQAFEPSDLP